uniref:CASP-like protein n=1 Tax=Oryza brachyantha TaxID=4533 RepID=J3MGE6_ORYBR
MGEEQRCSTVAAALLVLVACNLTLALSKLSPPPSPHDDPARVDAVGYLASVASSVLAAVVASSAACRGRLSVEAVLWETEKHGNDGFSLPS